MKYHFDEEIDRRGTCSLKWDYPEFFYARHPGCRMDEDTIRLQIADMDFACAPAIERALQKAAEFRNYGYAHADANPRYRASIVEWYQRRYRTQIEKDSIVYCGGALEGVRQAIRNFTAPGEGVIVCKPVYSNFMEVIGKEGRNVVNCPLENVEESYSMNWELFEQVCRKKENRVFVLCSPENPVGRVWEQEELARMAEICRENEVVLVSDEIHSDIVRKGRRHIPITAAAADPANIIMIGGPNKSFNLMGLHCAYAVIPDKKLRERFEQGFAVLPPTVFSIEALIAAYDESEEWLDELLEYLDDNMEYAVRFLHENLPKVKVQKPEGTYVLWADFAAYGLNAEELYERIGMMGNVLLQGGQGCDSERGMQYLRICLTCTRPTLEEAMKRIAQSMAGLQEEDDNEGRIRGN